MVLFHACRNLDSRGQCNKAWPALTLLSLPVVVARLTQKLQVLKELAGEVSSPVERKRGREEAHKQPRRLTSKPARIAMNTRGRENMRKQARVDVSDISNKGWGLKQS